MVLVCVGPLLVVSNSSNSMNREKIKKHNVRHMVMVTKIIFHAFCLVDLQSHISSGFMPNSCNKVSGSSSVDICASLVVVVVVVTSGSTSATTAAAAAELRGRFCCSKTRADGSSKAPPPPWFHHGDNVDARLLLLP